MTTVSAAQAVKEIDDLLDQVEQGRDVVIIGPSGAAFKPIALPRAPQPRFGSARGQVRIGADFDAPVEGFGEYIPGESCSIPMCSCGSLPAIPSWTTTAAR